MEHVTNEDLHEPVFSNQYFNNCMCETIQFQEAVYIFVSLSPLRWVESLYVP